MLKPHQSQAVAPYGDGPPALTQTDLSAFQDYLVDASGFRGSCEKVFFPTSEAQVVDILVRANRERRAVTVAGARTGLVGGAVPQEGWLLATDRFSKILSMRSFKESAGGVAVVEPGVRLQELAQAAEPSGLFYPPDPTEQSACVGGTIATNASGPRTYRFGPTRDYVRGIRVVLPEGDVIEIPRGRYFASPQGTFEILRSPRRALEMTLPDLRVPDCKHAAGYFMYPKMDLLDLFVGSEGTLGVITRAQLALERRPAAILAGVVFFPDEPHAVDFVIAARSRESVFPCALEYFDAGSLDLMRPSFARIPQRAGAAIFFEELFEDKKRGIERWLPLLEAHGADVEASWFATTRAQDDAFRLFRHEVAVRVNELVARRGVRKLGTDMAVPDAFLAESLRVYRALTSAFETVIFGHIGDNHLHVNILARSREEVESGLEVYEEIARRIVALGGTVSAEHGIGKVKRRLLALMYGEETLCGMRRLKDTLDPQGILSVGNLF